MNRLTRPLIIAVIAAGAIATFSVNDADAGWFHGGGCYRPSYSSCYNYVNSYYRPSFSYSNHCSPVVYRSTWTAPAFSNSWYGGYYGSGCGYGYNNVCGGYSVYRPLTSYGSYGAISTGSIVPVNYGFCGW